MDELMDGWLNGVWMIGWMGEWMDKFGSVIEWIGECLNV
jgi:hypothetical protein